MLTVVKFIPNVSKPANPNQLVSRTLLKIAQINRTWTGTYPKALELWQVRIVHETQHGRNRGCFIVDPIVKIDAEAAISLPPTLFAHTVLDHVVIVTPKYADQYWLLPKTHKQHLAAEHDAYAVVVNHGGNAWW